MTAQKKFKARTKLSPYGPKPRNGTRFTEPGRTKQSFKDECNINNIMARYQKSGAITHVQNNQPQYGFATARTFHESMNIVTKAQSMFAELPSSIRSKFKNDPAQFLDFVQDAGNADELVELGLANAPTPNPSDDSFVAPTASDEAPTPPPAEN